MNSFILGPKFRLFSAGGTDLLQTMQKRTKRANGRKHTARIGSWAFQFFNASSIDGETAEQDDFHGVQAESQNDGRAEYAGYDSWRQGGHQVLRFMSSRTKRLS
jgi:hypothetical protein